MDTVGKKAINIVHTNVTAESISRYEILTWINNTLGTNLQKVEDLCTGSIYCLLMDDLFGPGTVQLKKVKFHSHLENEYIQNFKILQVAFNNCDVDRAIPIEKLVKGRYNDNYDFAQWFKMFYDANYLNGGSGSRNKCRTADKVTCQYSEEGHRGVKKPLTSKQIYCDNTRRPVSACAAVPDPSRKLCVNPARSRPRNLQTQFENVQRKLGELNSEMEILESIMRSVQSEGHGSADPKLLEIETLCKSEDLKAGQSLDVTGLLHRIFRILKTEPPSNVGCAAMKIPGTITRADGWSPDSEGASIPGRGGLKKEFDLTLLADPESENDPTKQRLLNSSFRRSGHSGQVTGNQGQDEYMLPSIKEENHRCLAGDASSDLDEFFA